MSDLGVTANEHFNHCILSRFGETLRKHPSTWRKTNLMHAIGAIVETDTLELANSRKAKRVLSKGRH